MKFKSLLLSQASGKFGGLVAAHNKGGMYLRARSMPTNPASPLQAIIRGIMNQCSQAWVETLTPSERLGWETYAANVPLIDKLGESRPISGIAMFNRCNAVRLQTGGGIIKTAPTIFDLGTYTPPTLAANAADDDLEVTFTATDEWALEAGAQMAVFCSTMQNSSINFFKSPYRYLGRILGATPAPTSPAALPLPFAAVEDNRLFARIVILRNDGRVSLPWFGQCDIEAT
jgi:hypothetical protein